MSNALAVAQDKKQPIDMRVANIRDVLLANKDRIGRGIAGMLTPERAIMVACNSIRKNPKLLECTPQSLFGAIAEAAVYGWVCDGLLGHASLVPFRNSQRGTTEVTLIPGYKGLRDLIRRSGQCELVMESVHEGDEYEFRTVFELPHHVRSRDNERRFAPLTHAYVVGRFRDGSVKCFSWTRGECLAHRNRYSQNWKRNQKEDNPWHEKNPAFRVMCAKTVLLDAVHRGEFPMSVEDQTFATRELRHEVEPEQFSVPQLEEYEAVADDAADAVIEQSPPEEVGTGIDLEGAQADLSACKTIGECNALEQQVAPLAIDEGQGDIFTGLVERRKKEIRDSRGAGSNK